VLFQGFSFLVVTEYITSLHKGDDVESSFFLKRKST